MKTVEEYTDKQTNLTKRFIANRVIATKVKVGDVIQSPFMSVRKMKISKITETEKSVILTGNYIAAEHGGMIGKQWAYTFRKTTKVKIFIQL